VLLRGTERWTRKWTTGLKMDRDGPGNEIILTFMIQINQDYYVALKFYKALIIKQKSPTFP
jgi:hypothetical protein